MGHIVQPATARGFANGLPRVGKRQPTAGLAEAEDPAETEPVEREEE